MLILRALVIAVLLALVAPAGPAAAGGPTSAIVSVPGEGRTASLYYTDEEYQQLARLIGAESMSVDGEVDRSGTSHESGKGITVTWLIHDVDPWRVDRIYLGEEGPWIATQVMDPETGSIWDTEVVWHQPTSGKELIALLDELGVGGVAPVTPAPAPSTSSAESAPEPVAAEESDALSGAWWGLGGLVAGALLTLVVLRLRQSRPDDEPELDPNADWLAPQTRSTSA